MSLAAILSERIHSNGPITVADYMEVALTHPDYGYYITRSPFGRSGDFITAPDISQIFGELVGAWIANCWMEQTSPHVILLELGPGRGTLMADLLRATTAIPGFHKALDILLLEASPALRARQKQMLEPHHARIRWVESLEDLPSLPLFFIANEFFDALPIRQYVQDANGKKTERHVTLAAPAHGEEQFAFIPEGPVVDERSEAAETIATKLGRHIGRFGGAGLAIDYGYSNPGKKVDTLQAVREHHYVSPLVRPGEADLTAHVDFDRLAEAFRQSGTQCFGPVAQGTFLKRMGAELRTSALCRNADAAQRTALLSGLERLVGPAQMGELFKALAVLPENVTAPEGFARVRAAVG